MQIIFFWPTPTPLPPHHTHIHTPPLPPTPCAVLHTVAAEHQGAVTPARPVILREKHHVARLCMKCIGSIAADHVCFCASIRVRVYRSHYHALSCL